MKALSITLRHTNANRCQNNVASYAPKSALYNQDSIWFMGQEHTL